MLSLDTVFRCYCDVQSGELLGKKTPSRRLVNPKKNAPIKRVTMVNIIKVTRLPISVFFLTHRFIAHRRWVPYKIRFILCRCRDRKCFDLCIVLVYTVYCRRVKTEPTNVILFVGFGVDCRVQLDTLFMSL